MLLRMRGFRAFRFGVGHRRRVQHPAGAGREGRRRGAALAKLAGRAGEDVEAAATHEASTFCPLSFAPSTLVTTPKGKQPIASLKVGDKVVAYDPKTGKATTQTVEQTYITQDTGLLDVTLRPVIQAAKSSSPTPPAMDPTYKQRLAAVASHGSHAPPSSATKATTATTMQPGDETIHTTANHPWLSADHGWIVAGHLQLGEPVRRVDGSVAVVVALTPVHGTAPMWDLTVSQVHDFAVGTGAYVVHNCDPVKEGDAGSYGELSKRATKGDALEAHHMPQDARGFTSREEGGALVMTRGEHMQTRTWGPRGRITAQEEANLSFRQTLARDFRDVRRIVGSKYNRGLQNILRYYREEFPSLIARPRR